MSAFNGNKLKNLIDMKIEVGLKKEGIVSKTIRKLIVELRKNAFVDTIYSIE